MKKIILSALLLAAGFQASAQFTQNFDSSLDFPQGWNRINGGGENQWEVSSEIYEGAHSGTNAARLVFNSSAHNDYLIAPRIAVTTGVSDQVEFYVRSRSGTWFEPYEVRVSTSADPLDEASYSHIVRASSEAPMTWEKVSVDLSLFTGQQIYVAIRATGTNEFHMYVDDFANNSLPACSVVQSLSLAAIGTTTASIAVPANSDLGWEYVVAPATATSPDGLTVSTSATNPIELSGLSASTSYKIWVRRVCAEGEVSWSPALTFTTTCAALTIPTALESFENTTGTELPNCYSATVISGTNNWISYTVDGTGENPRSASGTRILRKAYGTSTALFVSAPINFSSATQEARLSVALQRHLSAHANDRYIVSINSLPTLNGATELFQLKSRGDIEPVVSTTGFYNYTANIPTAFSNVTSGFILIQGITENGTSSYALGIDDFKIEYVPLCGDVDGLAASNATASTVDVTWNAVTGVDGYVVAYGTSSDMANATQIESATNSLTIDGLASSSNYYFWVKSDCGENTGSWSMAGTFTTMCTSFAESGLPWSETFESLTSVGETIFPNCWLKENGDWRSAYNTATDNDIDGYDGSSTFIQNAWSADNEFIWTLGFELTAGIDYDFSFFYGSYGQYDDWTSGVYVNTTQSSVGATLLGGNFISEGTVAPSTYTNVSRIFTPATSGVYYFGISVSANSSPWYLNFDNFSLRTSQMSTGDFNTTEVSYFPNPVSDNLNVSASESIDSVEVYNLMGQKVAAVKGGNTTMSVDMSGLSAGVYVVKANAAKGSKSFRVIKK